MRPALNRRSLILRAVVVLPAIAVLVSCSRSATISGQVFVTTRGGENIKLGAVQVNLIDSKELLPILSSLQSDWLKAEDQAIDELLGMNPASEKTDAELKENLSLVSSGRDKIISRLPAPLLTTTTDAEGRFAFPKAGVGTGRALSACAERHLASFGDNPSVEHYCWLVPVPPSDSEQISVMLTGSNMIGVGGQGQSMVYRPRKKDG